MSYFYVHPAGCFKIIEEEANFDGARSGCLAIGAKLASPSKPEEYTAVIAYLASTGESVINLSALDRTQELSFKS